LTVHDDDLVRACLTGNAEAGTELVDLYWDRVYAFSYRLTLNRTDAEDIAQETFLRAFSNLSTYKPDGQFKSWLLRIASNLFLDLKKAARSRDAASSEIIDRALVQESPDQIAGRREIIDAFYKVMQTLSKEQQVVMMLRGIERLDYPEIADILKLKEATVRWHMYEARRIIRQVLSKKFDLEVLGDE